MTIINSIITGDGGDDAIGKLIPTDLTEVYDYNEIYGNNYIEVTDEILFRISAYKMCTASSIRVYSSRNEYTTIPLSRNIENDSELIGSTPYGILIRSSSASLMYYLNDVTGEVKILENYTSKDIGFTDDNGYYLDNKTVYRMIFNTTGFTTEEYAICPSNIGTFITVDVHGIIYGYSVSDTSSKLYVYKYTPGDSTVITKNIILNKASNTTYINIISHVHTLKGTVVFITTHNYDTSTFSLVTQNKIYVLPGMFSYDSPITKEVYREDIESFDLSKYAFSSGDMIFMIAGYKPHKSSQNSTNGSAVAANVCFTKEYYSIDIDMDLYSESYSSDAFIKIFTLDSSKVCFPGISSDGVVYPNLNLTSFE